MDTTIPSSRQVAIKSAEAYWVTAGEWNGIYGTSYEIGIRQKSNREQFWLIQGRWNERTIVKAAEAVMILLNGGLTPTEIADEILN